MANSLKPFSWIRRIGQHFHFFNSYPKQKTFLFFETLKLVNYPKENQIEVLKRPKTFIFGLEQTISTLRHAEVVFYDYPIYYESMLSHQGLAFVSDLPRAFGT